MNHLSSKTKHHILTLYHDNHNNYTFQQLADLHNIKGGSRVIRRWNKQWNGTPQSLERSEGSGRPSVLTAGEVDKYIRMPIRNKNRAHRAVHYPQLLSSIHENTGKTPSLQTVRRIGRNTLSAKQKRTIKRTTAERN